MGLAGVELLMAIEDRFGIEITEKEAAAAITVADLHQLVRTKLQALYGAVCQSSRTFYLIRKALMRVYGVERHTIKLDTPLELLFPLVGRVAQWRQFTEAVDLKVPDLERPRWMTDLIIVVSGTLWLLLLFAVLIPFSKLMGSGVSILAGIVSFFVVFLPCLVLLYKLTESSAVFLPRDCRTVRALVLHMVKGNHGVIRVSDDDIWQSLVGVFVDECRVQPDAVKPEALIMGGLCKD